MHLQKNDLVALVAPAGSLSDDIAVRNAQKLLSDWGLKSMLGKNVLKQSGHFAGTDIERLRDLQDALDNQDVKMIWALRGGYGTNRIVDELNFSEFKKHPKYIVGFSDITILHSKLHNLGFQSIHALMPVGLKDNISQDVLQQTKNAFFGSPVQYVFSKNIKNKNTENIKGIIVGGNLANLYSLLGTNLDIETKDKILLIEDIGEQLYQIDRMIISMKKAGKLENLKALFVGRFTDIPDNNPEFGKTYQEIILEHTQTYDYPVIFDVPVGHIADNYPVIFGKEVRLSVGKNLKISF